MDKFPETDWWCDRCGAKLNSQAGVMTIIMFGDARNAVTRAAFHQTTFSIPKMSF